jgi:very-short-patch-repair endonuclease
LLAFGYSRGRIDAQVTARRWQRPIPGIYVVFTGPLPARTICWVALLHAGGGAALSHATAGVLWRILPRSALLPVHLTVPRSQGVRPRTNLVVHHTMAALVGVASPPRTDVPTTALALCAEARRNSEITAVLARVAQRYPGALADIADLAAKRRTLRRRAEILAATTDVAGGAHSELERRYLVDVERRHRLPAGRRQRAVAATRQDVHYDALATTVELDGRAVHALADAVFRDLTRDNASAERGEIVLRYGWDDVRHRSCLVAAQVASVLRQRGWSGRPRPCRPGCPVVRVR